MRKLDIMYGKMSELLDKSNILISKKLGQDPEEFMISDPDEAMELLEDEILEGDDLYQEAQDLYDEIDELNDKINEIEAKMHFENLD